MHEDLWASYSKDRSIVLRNQLVAVNLLLVRKTAARFDFPLINEDLFQVGCIGLIKAIERFEPSLGNKFSSYALVLIHGEIRHYLRDKQHAVRRPRTALEPLLIASLNNLYDWQDGEKLEFIDMIIDDLDVDRVDVLNEIFCLPNDNQRRAIELHYLEDLPRLKVAEILDVRPITITRWLRKGITQLQNVLEVPDAA